MPAVNFYLKKPEGNPPRSLIYLQMRYTTRLIEKDVSKSMKFVYSIGENIEPKNWDKEKQVVKTRSQTTKDGSIHLNDLIADLRSKCLNEYNKQLATGVPTPKDLKAALDDFMNRKIKKATANSENGFFELIDRFINKEFNTKKGKDVTDGTTRTYKVAKMNLEAFQKEAGYLITYDTINLDFASRYIKFLRSPKKRLDGKSIRTVPGLSQNSIHKEIKNVRTFMNKAVKLKYTNNLSHKDSSFGIEKVKTTAIALSDKEVRNLFAFDFSRDQLLEQIRDMFIFSCFTGLRYSDSSNIKPENIINKSDGNFDIVLTTVKTKEDVVIPCNDVVIAIFKKYSQNKNYLPKSVAEQYFNRTIKQVCKLAGLTQVGRLTSEPDKPLYQLISSHTARRTFITNARKSGIEDRRIMSMTGHRDLKSLSTYDKVTKQDNADAVRESWVAANNKPNLKAI